MNLGSLFLLFAIIISAIMGLYLISAKNTPQPYSDSYGSFGGNETNVSYQTVGNITATAPSIGVGALVLVGLIIAIAILIVLSRVV